MKELTQEQYISEINSGTGVRHILGGTRSRNGKQILLFEDKVFLFEDYEIGDTEYLKILKMVYNEHMYERYG